MKPMVLAFILVLLMAIILVPLVFFIRNGPLTGPEAILGICFVNLFIIIPAITIWIGIYLFAQHWRRKLPDGVRFDDVVDTIQGIETTMRVDANWASRLRISTDSTRRMLRLVISNHNAKLYPEKDGSNILIVEMKRRVSEAERQLLLDFVDNAIYLAGKEAIARGDGQKS